MTIEPYIESDSQAEQVTGKKSKLMRFGPLLLVALMAMVMPASAAINLTSITADFVSIAGIITASVTVFEALMGLIIALVPIVIVIAIAKFIPGVFDKVLAMFTFR